MPHIPSDLAQDHILSCLSPTDLANYAGTCRAHYNLVIEYLERHPTQATGVLTHLASWINLSQVQSLLRRVPQLRLETTAAAIAAAEASNLPVAEELIYYYPINPFRVQELIEALIIADCYVMVEHLESHPAIEFEIEMLDIHNLIVKHRPGWIRRRLATDIADGLLIDSARYGRLESVKLLLPYVTALSSKERAFTTALNYGHEAIITYLDRYRPQGLEPGRPHNPIGLELSRRGIELVNPQNLAGLELSHRLGYLPYTLSQSVESQVAKVLIQHHREDLAPTYQLSNRAMGTQAGALNRPELARRYYPNDTLLARKLFQYGGRSSLEVYLNTQDPMELVKYLRDESELFDHPDLIQAFINSTNDPVDLLQVWTWMSPARMRATYSHSAQMIAESLSNLTAEQLGRLIDPEDCLPFRMITDWNWEVETSGCLAQLVEQHLLPKLSTPVPYWLFLKALSHPSRQLAELFFHHPSITIKPDAETLTAAMNYHADLLLPYLTPEITNLETDLLICLSSETAAAYLNALPNLDRTERTRLARYANYTTSGQRYSEETLMLLAQGKLAGATDPSQSFNQMLSEMDFDSLWLENTYRASIRHGYLEVSEVIRPMLL